MPSRARSIEGQEFRFINDLPVSFPADAIEVKAVWRPIREEDKARYQWAAMKDPKSGKMFNYDSVSNVGPGCDRSIGVNEVRGGLRHQFGNSDCIQPVPYVPEPEPVYTK